MSISHVNNVKNVNNFLIDKAWTFLNKVSKLLANAIKLCNLGTCRECKCLAMQELPYFNLLQIISSDNNKFLT